MSEQGLGPGTVGRMLAEPRGALGKHTVASRGGGLRDCGRPLWVSVFRKSSLMGSVKISQGFLKLYIFVGTINFMTSLEDSLFLLLA